MPIKRKPLHDEHDPQELMCLQLEQPPPFDDDDAQDSQFGEDPFEVIAHREEAQGQPMATVRQVP